MPIDIEKLMKFKVPVVSQVLTPKDVAFYALSVGLGRDPLDLHQLAFVDPTRELRIMPSMVLVLAHPGFWLADPDSGVDPAAILHAAQSFKILGLLPQEDQVESRTCIVEVIDKGPGKAALLHTESRLYDAGGNLFAVLDRTTFIRGGGGFGGSPGSATTRKEAPAADPDFVVDLATGREQALLYRLNGDLNPLHSDPAVATEAGFDAPILHGLCAMGVVTHALLRSLADYAPEVIRAVELRFSNPIFPGETIRTEIWRDGRFRASVPARGVNVIEDGFADVQAPPTATSGA
ncbi:MAG: MaoC/PaaZ C-terminal domain-containing protein [Martelella sp.]|uniref:MaoC family dehydratase n=1 Tax=Martelella sp. TaxID=1969699 RepID=UPI003241E6BD